MPAILIELKLNGKGRKKLQTSVNVAPHSVCIVSHFVVMHEGRVRYVALVGPVLSFSREAKEVSLLL